jgi:diaminohydroxyphosphoribosylaminopyrimidine deaminase / 5-amino-6-(5-phosphoribosylamino)uracil reductase
VTRDDLDWMRAALVAAEKGRGAVEPNPLVGAAVVRDGQLAGVGHHERFGGPHAEIVALRAAGEAARGATLYVTLEPCCHFGKTPPCTDAIVAAGIHRVVAAIRDPFPEVNGRGLSLLQSAGISIETGALAEPARMQNAPYLKRAATGLPYVTAKWAMTLDGKTAVAGGDSRWISCEQSRRAAHELRGRMDAIVVGIGTVETDDPLLTARPPGPRCATRIILDSRCRLPASSRLVQTARHVPVVIAATDRANPERCEQLRALGCEVIKLPGLDRVPIVLLLQELGSRGMTNLLLEGGGAVLGSFFDSSQIDALEIDIAPLIEGGDHARTAIRGRGQLAMSAVPRMHLLDNMTRIGDDLHYRAIVPQPWRRVAGFTLDRAD